MLLFFTENQLSVRGEPGLRFRDEGRALSGPDHHDWWWPQIPHLQHGGRPGVYGGQVQVLCRWDSFRTRPPTLKRNRLPGLQGQPSFKICKTCLNLSRIIFGVWHQAKHTHWLCRISFMCVQWTLGLVGKLGTENFSTYPNCKQLVFFRVSTGSCSGELINPYQRILCIFCVTANSDFGTFLKGLFNVE